MKRWPFDPWAKGMSSCHHPKDWRFIYCVWVEKCGSCGHLRFTQEPFALNPDYWPAATSPP